jgi:hypothetical protein
MKQYKTIKKIFLFTLFAALILCVSCSSKPKEKEPNDTFEEAQLINIVSSTVGSIGNETDKDYFMFECGWTGQISIELTSLKGINHQIVVYRKLDSKYAVLKRIDDSRKSSPEFMPSFGVMPGTYIIEISHGERDTPKGSTDIEYTLTLSEFVTENETNVEFEPNDLIRIATPIDSTTSMTGFYSPSFNKLNSREDEKYQEFDFFSFEVDSSQAGRYLADFTVSGVPGVDSVLTVYSPDGFPLNESDSGAIGAGESIVGQGLPEAGVYAIRLSVKNYASNNQDPYILNFSASMADSSIEIERNNEITSANIIRGDSVKGRIYPEGDKDFFTYIVDDEGKFITIRLLPTEDVNGRINIYNASGEKLFEVDNTASGMAEVVPAIFAVGRVFIEVEAFAGDVDAEKYYTLQTQLSQFQEKIELEPNDVKEQATPIDVSSMYGFSTFKADIDFYVIEADGREEIIFNFTPPDNSRFEVSITDNLGYVINSYEAADGEGIEFTELVNRRGYLKIEALQENYEAPYLIELFSQGQ